MLVLFLARPKILIHPIFLVIVVGVKELAGLVAMHWNISAIEVQHNFLGWSLVLFNEVMPQQFVGLDHGLPVYALFHAAQGRFARQNGLFTGRGLKCLISA